MPVTFDDPRGLWLLGALGPLVVLYVLRMRRQRRVVPSTWLWAEAQRDLLARHPFRRLLPELPLILETLAIVACALSLSGVSCSGNLTVAEHVALVVDTSASMGARDGASTRFHAARDAARAVVDGLPSGAEAIIIASAREPRTVTGLERDRRRLRAALDTLSPREEKGELAAAVALAKDRIERLPGRRAIVVVSDPGGEVPDVTGIPLDVVRVGAPGDNVGIVKVEVRRAVDRATGKDRAEALVVVQNFGTRAESRFVSMSLRGEGLPTASRKVELAPGERAAILLSFEPSPTDTGRGIIVQLSPDDALGSDDRAFAVIPPGPRLPVVLAADHAEPWLERAFSSDPDVELFRMEAGALSRTAMPRDALIVFDGTCPDAAPPNDLLVVDPKEGTCLGVHVGAKAEGGGVTSWADGDDRLRFVSLEELRFGSARPVEVSPRRALASTSRGAIIADLGLSAQSGTLVSFPLSESNWPLQASFVLFVRNVTETARANRARRMGTPAATGEVVRVPAPPGITAPFLRGPDGETPMRVADGLALGPPPGRAGFYDVAAHAGGPALVTVAVNLESPDESDLRRTPAATNRAAAATKGGPARATSTLAFVFCAALLALVVLEILWLTWGARTAARLPWPRLAMLGGLLALAGTLSATAGLVHAGLLREIWFRFERPLFVHGGLLATGLLVLRRRHGASPGGATRRSFTEAGLGLAAIAAALGASEPSLGSAFDRMALVVAIDRSRSTALVPDVDGLVERELRAAEAEMGANDGIAVVAFGRDASLEEPLRKRGGARLSQRAAIGRDGTDLAAGIRRALAEAPSDAAARIAVLSDGVATRGDTTASALSAALAGVPVDVVPLVQRPVANLRVESVRAPAAADVGETVDVRVATRSTLDTDVQVRVVEDGVPVQTGVQHVRAGEDVFWLRERVTVAGLHRWDVHVSAAPDADAVVEDDEGTAFIDVRGRARALVLEGDPPGAEPMKRALEAAAFEVDVASATRAPAAIDELARYDLVVLSDIPAHELSTEQIAELAVHAEKLGGGLLLMGGDRSMGPGGYAKTPVEDVSPVTFDLRNERRRARLSEVIAIDYSGSMSAPSGGHTKLELANEAAARSASLLGPLDRVGVLHADTAVAWTVSLAALTDPVGVGRKIRAVGPGGGGIYVDVALAAAYAALEREGNELKHLLLFADGDDAEERSRAPGLAEDARRHGITTSVVSLGRGHDTAGLEELSRRGMGRFYLIEDATRLPAVFAQETTIAAGDSIREVSFRASAALPSPATRGMDLEKAPPLAGYVVTRSKPRAEVSLRAAEGDPLLSTWNVGVGKAGAFTSDFKGRWGAAWVAWSDGARLFAQLGRHLARGARDEHVAARVSIVGGAVVVSATARGDDGESDSFRRLAAVVTGPSGFSGRVPMEPTGPGAYSATLNPGAPGGYVATLVDDSTNQVVGTACAVLSAAEELDPRGTDRAELARVARLTGGKVRDSLAGVFRDRPPPRRAYRSLVPFLSLSAALSLLGSVGARRLSLPSPGRRRREADARSRMARTPRPAPASVRSSLDPESTEARSPEVTSRDDAPGSGAGESAPTSPGAPPATTAEVLLERRKRRS